MKYFNLILLIIFAKLSFSQTATCDNLYIIEDKISIKSKHTYYDSDNFFYVLNHGSKYITFRVKNFPDSINIDRDLKVIIIDSSNVKYDYHELSRGLMYIEGLSKKKKRLKRKSVRVISKKQYCIVKYPIRYRSENKYTSVNYGFSLSSGEYKMYITVFYKGKWLKSNLVDLYVK